MPTNKRSKRLCSNSVGGVGGGGRGSGDHPVRVELYKRSLYKCSVMGGAMLLALLSDISSSSSGRSSSSMVAGQSFGMQTANAGNDVTISECPSTTEYDIKTHTTWTVDSSKPRLLVPGGVGLTCMNTTTIKVDGGDLQVNSAVPLLLANIRFEVSLARTLTFNCAVNVTGVVSGLSANLTGQGAIYNLGSVVFNNDVIFSDNANDFSGSGGAIVVEDDDASVVFNGKSTFLRNQGNSGGAIYVFGKGTVTFNGDAYFSSNIAYTNGGAIYAYDFGSTTKISSGSLTADHTHITFNKAATFVDNEAGDAEEGAWGYGEGGAIYSMGSDIKFLGDTLFQSNTALYGGALSINAWSTNTEEVLHITFGQATAAAVGAAGSIAATTTTPSVTFSGNQAAITHIGGGGAIHVLGGGAARVVFHDKVTFTANSAATGHGGVFAFDLTSSNSTRSSSSSSSATPSSTLTFSNLSSLSTGSSSSSSSFSYSYLSSTPTSSANLYNVTATTSSTTSGSTDSPTSTSTSGIYVPSSSNDNDTSTSASSTSLTLVHKLVHGSIDVNFEAAVAFTGNSALNGGVVYIPKAAGDDFMNVTLSFADSAFFNTNSATLRGGALFAESGRMTFGSSVLFSNNTGQSNDLTVYATSPKLMSFKSTVCGTDSTSEFHGVTVSIVTPDQCPTLPPATTTTTPLAANVAARP